MSPSGLNGPRPSPALLEDRPPASDFINPSRSPIWRALRTATELINPLAETLGLQVFREQVGHAATSSATIKLFWAILFQSQARICKILLALETYPLVLLLLADHLVPRESREVLARDWLKAYTCCLDVGFGRLIEFLI